MSRYPLDRKRKTPDTPERVYTPTVGEIMLRRYLRDIDSPQFNRLYEVLVVKVYIEKYTKFVDIVWEDGLPLFYSMKLVKGRTLQAILDDLRTPVSQMRSPFLHPFIPSPFIPSYPPPIRPQVRPEFSKVLGGVH